MKKLGFTLIELIIVVAIIALLAAATFVAVNPAKRLGNSQDAKRWEDVTAMADAWAAYSVDYGGNNATSSTDCITAGHLCKIANYGGNSAATQECGSTTTLGGTIWLDPLVDSGYIPSIPADPKSSTAIATTTGYYFMKYSTGTIRVGACDKYGSDNIMVDR